MTRIAILFCALAVAFGGLLHAAPARAQRVFVSGSGSDANPCTFPQPCRTFQQAFSTVAAGGEIDVLDPAGYGSLTITHAISIQAHGFGGITQAANSVDAITVNAGASDAVTLNGLLIDGVGTGDVGISINTAGSVQILNCVVRHFQGAGVSYTPHNSSANLLVSDTIASDNNTGIEINPLNHVLNTPVTLSRITANDNDYGIVVDGDEVVGKAYVMIANSVVSNSGTDGILDGDSSIWLAKSVISGNLRGIYISGGVVDSYGDNYINGNSGVDINGTLGSSATR